MFSKISKRTMVKFTHTLLVMIIMIRSAKLITRLTRLTTLTGGSQEMLVMVIPSLNLELLI